MSAMDRLLAFMAMVSVSVATAARSESKTPRFVPKPHAELAVTTSAVSKTGLHAELPPHISTLLGLTREENCAVMQGVLRSAGMVEGIDVAEKNHNDVVIFVVDESTSKQMLYLTSPSGALRKLLVVEKGVGRVAKPSRSDLEAFRAEKRMWVERMGTGKQR